MDATDGGVADSQQPYELLVTFCGPMVVFNAVGLYVTVNPGEAGRGRSSWWALASGAAFGGDGTIIGSAWNVVTVALSEKTNTTITSRMWMRAVPPVLVVTCVVGSIPFGLCFASMKTP